jgi:hypothetical protein
MPGVRNGDLLAVVLPLRELENTEKALIRERFPVEKLMIEGRLLLFASEELLPPKGGGCEKMREAILALKARTDAQGRNLRLVGRVAPMLFERGDVEGALAVEIAADSSLGHAKLLCLYDARRREELPKGHAQRIDDVHNHSLDETSRGSVTLRVGRMPRPAKRTGKSRKA